MHCDLYLRICTECLQIPSPVSIVLSCQCMDIYNEAFRFLLQIKRVKYSLDRLKFLGSFKSYVYFLLLNYCKYFRSVL